MSVVEKEAEDDGNLSPQAAADEYSSKGNAALSEICASLAERTQMSLDLTQKRVTEALKVIRAMEKRVKHEGKRLDEVVAEALKSMDDTIREELQNTSATTLANIIENIED